MSAPRQEASSARKLLRLPLAFDAARPTWAVAELAANVGLSLSTTYRQGSLLRQEGLLEPAPGSDALYRTESRPFGRPETSRFAVKVINGYGDEVMKVFDV